jgi:hypothetical protein
MTKPKTEHRRPTTDDAELAFAEASALLGFGRNPATLCGADRVRVGMVAGLMAAVDAATESLLAGNSSAGDIGRLTSSVDALVRLLPKSAVDAPTSSRSDPRQALLTLILEQRERAGVPPEGVFRATINALQAENARLRARLGDAPTPVERDPNPPHSNVVPDIDVVPPGEQADRDPGPRPGPDDRRPAVTIDADAVDIRAGFDDTPEPWRPFSHLYER